MHRVSAFVLVGPTATGKTAVAQHIAEQAGYDIICADSMLVYRGMDVGTAKPAESARGRVRYWCLDLVGPGELFSLGGYVAAARKALQTVVASGHGALVTGGTGLYVKALIEGMSPGPASDPDVRARLESVLAAGGIVALQRMLRAGDAGAYERLADKRNPRRLIRALERVEGGYACERQWRSGPDMAPVVGLAMPREVIRRRIRQRAAAMFEQGLVEEVDGLLAGGLAPGSTAYQAIGYAEAMAVLGGRISREAALERTIARTCKLARRQMTWFRRQLNVAWVEVAETMSVADVAKRVRAEWEKHGATAVSV